MLVAFCRHGPATRFSFCTQHSHWCLVNYLHGGNYSLRDSERGGHSVDSVEKRLFVLLQVLIVRRWQALQGHKETGHLSHLSRELQH